MMGRGEWCRWANPIQSVKCSHLRQRTDHQDTDCESRRARRKEINSIGTDNELIGRQVKYAPNPQATDGAALKEIS